MVERNKDVKEIIFMGFNEAVIHDLLLLENDMMNARKELKKLKRVNFVQWVAIAYLLCKVNKDKEELIIEDKVKEKCKKMFNKRREK